jgi:hypothetical protein
VRAIAEKQHRKSASSLGQPAIAALRTRRAGPPDPRLLPAREERGSGSAGAAHNFGRISIHPPAAGAIQAKLAVNAPGDEYEREADHVADRVMGMPGPALDRFGAGPRSPANRPGTDRVQLRPGRFTGGGTTGIVAPPAVHEALASPGRPLDSATRAFMEPRLGRDFAHVRVHTDEAAARGARSVRARAFARGSDVVFGAGEYAPHSPVGRHLLAHELAHVVQQGPRAGAIQRAEIDDRSHTCATLQDSTSLIEELVNGVLDAARGGADGDARVKLVYDQLGAGSPYSGIENFIYALPTTHQHRVAIEDSKFAGMHKGGSGTINPWVLKGEGTLGTVIRLGSRCIGSDKLGHFFQQGRDYFHISMVLGKGDAHAEAFGAWLEGKASADPAIQAWIDDMDRQGWPGFDRLAYNFSFWQGVYGLSTTGVYAPADLAANSAGMAFYKNVHADPNTRFRIADYLGDSWNEESNPSCYGSATAKQMAMADPELGESYRTVIRDALKNNPFMSAYAAAGTLESMLPKYIKKYECPP